MRTHRLYTEQPLVPETRLALEPSPSRHAAQVLRLAPGDPLVLFNGDGRDYSATIETATRNHIQVRIESAGELEPDPRLAITLAIGIARGERMDFALQKAVELGVTDLQPLFTSRTVVRLSGDRLVNRARHWQGVIIGACEQSGRSRPPLLQPACSLGDWLDGEHPNAILLNHAARLPITDLPAPNTRITLLIGPEGGLEPAERQLAQARGFTAVRLGPRVLRTETAPLAAIAVIQALWGDFGL